MEAQGSHQAGALAAAALTECAGTLLARQRLACQAAVCALGRHESWKHRAAAEQVRWWLLTDWETSKLLGPVVPAWQRLVAAALCFSRMCQP